MIPKGYKSMDSAPKDGSDIWAVFSDGKSRWVFWQDNQWMRDDAHLYPNEPIIPDYWADEDGNCYGVYDALFWKVPGALDVINPIKIHPIEKTKYI